MRKKTLKELTIRDNFMFCTVMCEEENSKRFLEMVLGEPIERVEVYKEKCLVYNPKYKGVRLDVYIKGNDNKRYNIEMQARTKKGLTKRVRYYHSHVDMELIETGTTYKNLPDVLVLFVCDFDPFKKGRYCYTVENKCIEDTSVDIADGVKSIYLSTKGKNKDEVSESMVKFLKYVSSDLDESEADFEDEFVEQLQRSVAHVKESREQEGRYMELWELLEETHEDGIEQGRREQLLMQVNAKLKKGKSVEEMADALELDLETVYELIEEIKSQNLEKDM